MFVEPKQSVDDPIVSIHQPRVHLFVRGKSRAKVKNVKEEDPENPKNLISPYILAIDL